MFDQILYIENTEALPLSTDIFKNSVCTENGNKALVYIRTEKNMETYPQIRILSKELYSGANTYLNVYNNIFENENLMDIYLNIYDISPKKIVDDDGYTQEYNPPKIFGYIAQSDNDFVSFSKSFTYKTEIWERMTDDEAEVMDAALEEAPAKQRRMWDDSITIEHSSDYYSILYALMESKFGEDRTDIILSPSEEK